MKIGIDVDDTLALTTDYIMPFALKFDREVLKKDGNVDLNLDLPRCFVDWTKDDLFLFFKTIFEKEVLNIPAMENASEVIKKLRADGHSIVIISSRSNTQLAEPYEMTQKWLEQNNIVVDKIIVGARYKGPVIEEEHIDLLIDDSVGQCTFIADNNKIPVIMYAKDINNINYPGITRLNNWNEIYEYISKLATCNK